VSEATAPFDGVWLERRADGSLWAHEQFEIGVNRFSDVRSVEIANIDDALDRYLTRLVVRGQIDGVPFDPHS
jgi:hypothetical protein